MDPLRATGHGGPPALRGGVVERLADEASLKGRKDVAPRPRDTLPASCTTVYALPTCLATCLPAFWIVDRLLRFVTRVCASVVFSLRSLSWTVSVCVTWNTYWLERLSLFREVHTTNIWGLDRESKIQSRRGRPAEGPSRIRRRDSAEGSTRHRRDDEEFGAWTYLPRHTPDPTLDVSAPAVEASEYWLEEIQARPERSTTLGDPAFEAKPTGNRR